MIARLTDGPVVPGDEPCHDIWQATKTEPDVWIRMAKTPGGSIEWVRLYEDSPPWPHGDEAVYRLVNDGNPVENIDDQEVFVYSFVQPQE